MAQPTFTERAAPPFARHPVGQAMRHIRFAMSAALAGALPAMAATAPPTQLALASPIAYEFSADLLVGGASAKVDVSRFSLGNPLIAGLYRADIYVNGRWLVRRDLRIAGEPSVPCIDAETLRLIGLSSDGLKPEGTALLARKTPETPAASTCQAIDALTRDATAIFDSGELRLEISVPQISLAKQPKGYLPPEAWDRGITAALLNYNLNAYRTSTGKGTSDSFFAGINGGVNLDRWRLRHSGTYSRTTGSKATYSTLGTFASTDLPALMATLSIGEVSTNGQLISSSRVRGVTLASDERMLPDSRRGYAPVIRGVANSNARVEVRQNNQVLLSLSVPPGPFEINDLYPAGYGGDLQVVIIEADGTQRVSTVPYSSLPQLLRAGNLYYNTQVGQVQGYRLKHGLLQGTVQFGYSDDLTLAGGLRITDKYASALIGSAWNTPVGAMQANVNAARFRRNDTERHEGWSLDASWAKVFPQSGTSFSLAAYRYSSRGYFTLDDALRVQDQDRGNFALAKTDRVRNRAMVSVTQSLTAGMSVHFSMNAQNYWGQASRQSSYTLGLYKQVGAAQLSLSAAQSRSPFTGLDQRTYSVGLTLPLGGPALTRNIVVAYANHDSVSGDSQRVGLFGSYGERSETNYSVNVQRESSGSTLAANGTYSGKYAIVGIGASSGRGINQQSLYASGGIVAADGHVAFAPYLGDTVGLIKVEGAKGMRITAGQSAELDNGGYTLAPYLAPYTANPVELTLSNAPLGARFESTSAIVAPHAGAVVLLNFKRLSGYTLMLRARRADGTAVPFGASVLGSDGTLIGSVGQAGRIEAATPSLNGSMKVTWGEGPSKNCIVRYDLPKPLEGVDEVIQAQVSCEPMSGPVQPAERPPTAPVAVAPFETKPLHKPYLLVVTDPSGVPLPPGAELAVADNTTRVSIVAAGGRAVWKQTPAELSQSIQARWIDRTGQAQHCAVQVTGARSSAAPQTEDRQALLEASTAKVPSSYPGTRCNATVAALNGDFQVAGMRPLTEGR